MSATAPAPSAEAGASARLAELYRDHSRMVVGLCRLLLRDAEEAEDAAQQSFLSAYRGMLSGTEPRRPGPWLAQIARNECRARAERKARGPVTVADLDRLQPEGLDTAALAERRSQLEEATAAIAALPRRQREAVLLRHFHGLSHREVASALSVSVPITESLLFRARRTLKAKAGGTPALTHAAWVVPATLHAELARLVPGFGSQAAAGAGGAGAGLASLAKLASLPAAGAAKLAALPAGGKVAAGALTAVVAVGAATGPPIVDRIGGSGSTPTPVASVAAGGSRAGAPTQGPPVSADRTGPGTGPTAEGPDGGRAAGPDERDGMEARSPDPSGPGGEDGEDSRGGTPDDDDHSGPGPGGDSEDGSESHGPGSGGHGLDESPSSEGESPGSGRADQDGEDEPSGGSGPVRSGDDSERSGSSGDRDDDGSAVRHERGDGDSGTGGKHGTGQQAGEADEHSGEHSGNESDDDDSSGSGSGGSGESSGNDESDSGSDD